MAMAAANNAESMVPLLSHLPDEDWTSAEPVDTQRPQDLGMPTSLMPNNLACAEASKCTEEEEHHGRSKLFKVTSVPEEDLTSSDDCAALIPTVDASHRPVPLSNGLQTHEDDNQPSLDSRYRSDFSKTFSPRPAVPAIRVMAVDQADDKDARARFDFDSKTPYAVNCKPRTKSLGYRFDEAVPAVQLTKTADQELQPAFDDSVSLCPTREQNDNGAAAAILGSGMAARVHYRKQKERHVSDAGRSSAKGTSGAGVKSRSQSLMLPVAGRLAECSAVDGKPLPSPPRSPTTRNISTLSLTMLLRDQRRKNLAMLARLFAARQKEKDMLEGPQAMHEVAALDMSKQQQCRRWGAMEIFIGILFCVLVALVTASLVLFDPRRGDVALKHRGFNLDKDKGLLVVSDGRGQQLKIRVGVGADGPRYSCLSGATQETTTAPQLNCMRWQAERATLDVRLAKTDDTMTCVDVRWTWKETALPSSAVMDCIDTRGASWYGGADSDILPWSIKSAKQTKKLLFSPGSPDVGPIAERFWLSDRGHLVADSSSGRELPLYVEVTDGGESVCMSDSHGYWQRYTGSSGLSYVACVARDVGAAHRWMMQARLNTSHHELDGAARADPIWTLPADDTDGYVQRVLQHRFGHSLLLLEGNILLRPVEDTEQRLAAAAESLSRANVTEARLGLTVSPVLRLSSDIVLSKLQERLWFSSLPDDLPLLMHNRATGEASVLMNLSLPGSRELMVARLTTPTLAHWLSAVVLGDAGAASVMALEHHGEVRQESVADFARAYAGLRENLRDAGYHHYYLADGGIAPGSALGYLFPQSTRQRPVCSVLAHMLAASLAGYAVIDIGPFEEASANGTDVWQAYASWMQLSALSSAMHFGTPPWMAPDGGMVVLAHRLLEFRRNVILPRLQNALRAFAIDGTPVYKPVWWDGRLLDKLRSKKAGAAAASQFFIDDVLVAPVCDGKTHRLVFLPEGYWQDAVGDVFIGPDIFNYSAALSPVPYFVQRPVGEQ